MKLPAEFDLKEYRDAFNFAGVDNRLAFQIFAMREQRQWSQATLGEKTNTLQPAVCRWEKPGNPFRLATLKKIASAFDVGLVVGFVPWSAVADWHANLRPGSLEVPNYEAEKATEEHKASSVVLQGPATWTGGKGQMTPGPQLGLPLLHPVKLNATTPKQVHNTGQMVGTDTRMVANAT